MGLDTETRSLNDPLVIWTQLVVESVGRIIGTDTADRGLVVPSYRYGQSEVDEPLTECAGG